MEKHGLTGLGKYILAVVVTASLGVIGISHASWSDPLQITGRVTTGIFDMAFSPDRQGYAASIVDAEGTQTHGLAGVEIQLNDQGKAVDVTFQNGLPLDRLLDGDMIKLSYPLTKGDQATVDIKQYEPDFTVPWKTVEMMPQLQSLILDGQEYTADLIPAGYSVPLKLDVFQAFTRRGGSLYFKLTDESRKNIRNLPQTVDLSRENLEAGRVDAAVMHPAIAAAGGRDGVLLVYTCTVQVGLDQNNADDSIINAGEGGVGA